MTATFHGIPVFRAVIGEDDGMLRVSLVDCPAVESDFQVFAEEKPVQLFSVADEEKRIVRGVVMRADYPIYRRNDEGYEYYIVYTADTIREMAEKYLLDGRQNDVNIMHRDGSDVDGVQMVQYFIKDSAAGISPAGFDDIADGSLFAEYHIVNDDVWAKVKDGTFRGFSLEGYFTLEPIQKLKKQTPKSNIMSKINKFREAIRKALMAFAEVTTDKGVLGWDGDDDLKEGDAVYIVDADGNRVAAADGDYITEDGKVIAVSDGKVASITDPEAEVESFGETETEGGILYHEGNEDLKEGDAVYSDAELSQPAADGDYKTADGKTITVVEGKVASIKDPDAEVEPEETPVAAAFRRMREAFEESYNEKMDRIADAIAAKGYRDFYVIEAGDDFAVAEVWEDEGSKTYRFPVSWNEDGTANVGEPIEVKPMFVPLDYESPFSVKDAEELRRLRKEVERYRRMSAAKPAHEEEKMHGISKDTGVRGLDKIARLMRK